MPVRITFSYAVASLFGFSIQVKKQVSEQLFKLFQLSQHVSEDNFTLAPKVTSIPMIKKTEKCYGLNVRRAFS